MDVEVIKRPQKFAEDRAQIESSIKHVLNVLKKKENYVPDLIVLLQNTSPLRNEKHIDEALNLFFKKKYDSVFSGHKAHIFLWRKKNDLVHPMNYNPRKRPRRQDDLGEFLENGAIYITKLKLFKKNNCRISGKTGIYVMPKEFSIDIDNKLDLFLASEILKRFNKK